MLFMVLVNYIADTFSKQQKQNDRKLPYD